jgi:hypothetical protein
VDSFSHRSIPLSRAPDIDALFLCCADGARRYKQLTKVRRRIRAIWRELHFPFATPTPRFGAPSVGLSTSVGLNNDRVLESLIVANQDAGFYPATFQVNDWEFTAGIGYWSGSLWQFHTANPAGYDVEDSRVSGVGTRLQPPDHGSPPNRGLPAFPRLFWLIPSGGDWQIGRLGPQDSVILVAKDPIGVKEIELVGPEV